MKYLAVICILGFVLLSGGYFWNDLVQGAERILWPVERDVTPTMTVEARPYRLVIHAQGELVGLQTFPVQTPRIRRRGSLKVSWLKPEGSIVEKGEVVVTFDPSDAEITLQESQNEFKSFSHQIDQTEDNSEGEIAVLGMDRDAARAEFEYAEGQIRKDEQIFSRWEIQESIMSAALAGFKEKTFEEKTGLRKNLTEADLQILGIDADKAREEIELAEETLSSLALTAPATGVLIYIERGMNPLEVGNETWRGQTLMEIASIDQFRGRVQVPERQLTSLEEGQSVDIWLNAYPEHKLIGKVDQIARVAEQIDREDPRKYFEVDLVLETKPGFLSALKPGMELEADIEIRQDENGIVVPKSALFREQDRWVTYIQEGEEFVEKEVKIVGGDHGFYVVEGIDVSFC